METLTIESAINFLSLEELSMATSEEDIMILRRLYAACISKNKVFQDILKKALNDILKEEIRLSQENLKGLSFHNKKGKWTATREIKGKVHFIKASENKQEVMDALIKFSIEHNLYY